VSQLDPATAALVRFALAVPDGDDQTLARSAKAARVAGTPSAWLDELVLSAVLFVGFPRALVAAAAVREVWPEPEVGEPMDFKRWEEWQQRGEATCRTIYRERYTKLRRNLATLHPALDQMVVVDGYGKTQGRPGLDLRRRELCSVAMLVPLRTPRQMQAHLRGALNAGATPEEIEAVFQLAEENGAPAGRLALARQMWKEMQGG
jgi:4-carboxymuconolactone decarboxylase